MEHTSSAVITWRTLTSIHPGGRVGLLSHGRPVHDDSVRIIHKALDAGINFVDTADAYSSGESEEIVACPTGAPPPDPSGERPAGDLEKYAAGCPTAVVPSHTWLRGPALAAPRSHVAVLWPKDPWGVARLLA
jgi:hypothetical protein